MSNFTNYVEINIREEYQDIFNTIAQSRKLMMDPGTTNQQAAEYVEQTLVESRWNQPGVNRDRLIMNLAITTIEDLNNYLNNEDPGHITEIRIRQLISEINNYIINNELAEGHKRKTRKSKKSRKSRKSRRSRK
jgi:hypothetical protein